MSDTQVKPLIILDGTNYPSWKTRIMMKLRNKRLLSCIENIEGDNKSNIIDLDKDSLALEMLLDSIHPSLDHLIEDLSTSKEVWDKLKSHFDKNTLTSVMSLFSSVSNVVKTNDESIRDLSHRIKSSYRKMNELKLTLEDFPILTLLNSLPHQYESIISTITDKSRNEWNFDEIVEKLIEAESRFNKWEQSETIDLAMKTKGNLFCKFCKKNNHSTSRCYQNPDNKGPRPEWYLDRKTKSNSKSSNTVSLISQTALKTHDIDNNNVWYIDSGATQHFSPHKELFIELEDIENYKVNIANGSSIDVTGKGKVEITVLENDTPKIITVNNVHYAPKMSFNLLSVSQLDQNGTEILFSKGKCIIHKNNQLVLEITKQNNSYKINGISNSCLNSTALYIDKKIGLEQWHHRLGHSGKDQLKLTVNNNNSINKTIGQTDLNWNCKTCFKGKLSVKPIIGSLVKAKKPLEIVHSDVCGPIQTTSVDGFKYYVSFIDDFTHMAVIILIKSKSEVSNAFQEYISLAENQLDLKIKQLHSDNGTEYTSREFQTILKSHGIVHSTTAPYTPQQNGVAERYNRTLIESATCLLYEHNIDIKFWDYAVKYANRIRNRLNSKSLNNKSPYYMWYGEEPNLSHFRVFGCLAITEVPKIHRKKFDSHTRNCIYLGTKSDHGIYYLYNPQTNKVFNNRNVKFIENETIKLNYNNLKQIILINEYYDNSENSDIINSQPMKLEENDDESDAPNIIGDVTSEDSADQSNSGTNSSNFSENSNFDKNATIERITKLKNKVENFDKRLNLDSINDYSTNTDNSQHENFMTQYKTAINDPQLTNSNLSDELSYNPNQLIQNKPNILKIQQLREWEDHIKKVRFTEDNNSSENNDTENANIINENYSEFALSSINGPKSYKSAMNTKEVENWKIAINEELNSINKNNVWEIIKKPTNTNIVSTRWVFVKKIDDKGNLQKYKARLVARGFEQIHGIDYFDTFAPVVRFNSIRLIFAIAVQNKMIIHQMDVKTAFLNGTVDEEIYIEIPEGVNGDREKCCCRLNKSLYGLKQSPMSWNRVLDEFLKTEGLIRTSADYGVYIKKTDSFNLIVTTYVDDLLIASENLDIIINFKKSMTQRFEMSDLGEMKYILGIEVLQLNGSIKITQTNYIAELIKNFKLDDARTYNTPMEANIKLIKNESDKKPLEHPYASLIGSLLYLSNCTRPDITFAVNKLSSYNSNPNETHWKCAMRVLRYLKKTSELGITYSKSNDFILNGFSDADWANDLDTRRSTTGYFVTLNKNPISWNSKRQSTVATSTAEAEYMAIYETVRELLWVKKLMTDLMFRTNSVKIFCDNQSAIHIAKNPVMHQRSKHIDIKYHFIRQKVSENSIELNYLPSEVMTADILTKPLPFPSFTELRLKLLNDTELKGSVGNPNSNN
jgi:hypothetical protein